VSATRAQRTARARRVIGRIGPHRGDCHCVSCVMARCGAEDALRHLLRVTEGEVRERIWDLLATLEGKEVPR